MVGHVLRNSVGAALSMTGLQVGLMFSGVLVVEQVFGWPGIGQYIAQSIPVADFPAIAGVTLLLGVLYVAINTVVDLLQAAADPRIAVARRLGANTTTDRGQPGAGRRRHPAAAHMPVAEVGIPHHARARRARRTGGATGGRGARRRHSGGVLPGGAPAQRRRLRPRARRHRGCALRRGRSGHRPRADAAAAARRVRRSSTSSSGATRVSSARISRSCCAGCGPSTLILIGGLTDVCVHYTFADAHQRDFYVRVVDRLRRRVVAVPARRVAGRHGVPADRRACAAPTRSSPRSLNGAASRLR